MKYGKSVTEMKVKKRECKQEHNHREKLMHSEKMHCDGYEENNATIVATNFGDINEFSHKHTFTQQIQISDGAKTKHNNNNI